jgi:hypothetical protein
MLHFVLFYSINGQFFAALMGEKCSIKMLTRLLKMRKADLKLRKIKELREYLCNGGKLSAKCSVILLPSHYGASLSSQLLNSHIP